MQAAAVLAGQRNAANEIHEPVDSVLERLTVRGVLSCDCLEPSVAIAPLLLLTAVSLLQKRITRQRHFDSLSRSRRGSSLT